MTTSSEAAGARGRRWPLWVVPVLAGAAASAVAVLPGDYRTATVLGLVQGVAEFLPISSSAHLIVAPWLFGFEGSALNTLTYDVALHLGTTVALLVFFWRDWLQLGLAALRPRSNEGKLFWLLVIASLPGAVAGYFLDDLASTTFRSPLLIAGTLASMGVLLYLADHYAGQRRTIDNIGARDAVAVGIAQAVALIPGVSRSGSTMAMGRVLGLRRESAARFSFLMAVPITTGALLFKLKDLEPASVTGPFMVGILVSGVAGALSIRFLLNFLNKRSNSFLPFVIYRLGLAGLILVVYLLRRG
ncbi:MAG: undecaprenyl-diphosphate phosphatase [Chloroflexota bacterium]|nr:undecaprenyl-diphosphate phosphatase [Chloroflexota bacterium]